MIARALFVVLALASLTPWVSAPMALVGGVVFALSFGQPYAAATRKWTSNLLQIAVIGLGAAMDLRVVARVGVHGIGYTLVGIAFTIGFGTLLARLLKTDPTTSLLVSVGTAICGGSAIAAVAPVVRARGHQTSVALAVVFLLNSAALVIFPRIGHAMGLGEEAFGLWSALAIHDTSSVVGSALQFGPHALDVATTVKLARALWIIPVALLAGKLQGKPADGEDAPKAKKPWFILGFVLVAALVTFVPGLRDAGALVAAGSRHVLVLSLFLVGSSITRDALKTVGPRPLVQGVVLWLVVASATLGAIASGWVSV